MAKRVYYERPKRVEKLSRNDQLELMFDLVNSFRIVKSPIETANFLKDLLSSKEIKNLSKRLRIAKLLLNEIHYEEIVRTLHVSYATVAKVSTWLGQGGEGFKKVISKLPRKYNLPKNLPATAIEFQIPAVLTALAQYSVAKNQNENLERFLSGVKEKESLDRSLIESFSEEYKLRKSKNKQRRML